MKKVISIILIIIFTLITFSSCSNENNSKPITMAALGMPTVAIEGTNGDTWYATWLSDDEMMVQYNDGYGFAGTVGGHSGICKLYGTPEEFDKMYGENVNPVKEGDFIGTTYSSNLYEVDGVLYHTMVYEPWWQNPCMYKSYDKGVTWINYLGEENTLVPIDVLESTFPNPKFQYPIFVQYGKGGAAPSSDPGFDKADEYVYLFSPDVSDDYYWENYYLARIKREDLPKLDKTLFEFYIGGGADGMKNSSWVAWNEADDIKPMIETPVGATCASIYYNEKLGRYLMISGFSNSFANPQRNGFLQMWEAPHVWGPWTMIANESPDEKHGMFTTYTYFLPKFTSSDGTKSWMTCSGNMESNNYNLHFLEMYTTTEPVTKIELDTANLKNLETVSDETASAGKCITGFDNADSQVELKINVEKAGAYMINLQYKTNVERGLRSLNAYINSKQETIKMSQTGQYAEFGEVWGGYSIFAWFNKGENTITIKAEQDSERTQDVSLDCISYALYSTEPNSLPGCTP